MRRRKEGEEQGRGGWNERESDDQVLAGLMRDAHICRSPMIFTQSPSLSARRKEEGVKAGSL